MKYIKAISQLYLLIAADQVSKYFASVALKPIGSKTLINGVFNLTYVENKGAAFGMFQGGRYIFIALTIIIITALAYYYTQLPQGKLYDTMRFMLVLIAAGAIGNFIDRLRLGYVVDFFHFTLINFPVFNVADICIVVGTFSLAAIILFFMREQST